MLKESLIKTQLAIDKQESILVFQKQLPNTTTGNPIEAFIKLLRNKHNGYWLLRESRVEGMITVTFKNNNQIQNMRFVFSEDRWTIVGDEKVPDYKNGLVPFESLTKDTVTPQINLLLETIYQALPQLTLKKIILPSKKQASHNPSYVVISPYVLINQRNGKDEKIYANLLDSLNKLEQIMNERLVELNKNQQVTQYKMDMCNEVKLPLKIELSAELMQTKPFLKEGCAKQLKDLFANWLTTNDLQLDLFCPVGLDLFEEPYYIVESGHVFDVSSLFPNGGDCLATCPLTRASIQTHPVHFEGYRRTLSERIGQFFELVQLYQEKMSGNMQDQNRLTHSKNEEFAKVSSFSIFTEKLPVNDKEAPIMTTTITNHI